MYPIRPPPDKPGTLWVAMLLVTQRERDLISRIGPVLLRRFDELEEAWRTSWASSGGSAPPVDLPHITVHAVRDGIEAGLEAQRSEAERAVREGVPLDEVVSAVLLWEEVIVRRLARDAVEDIFSGASALNRFLHNLVLLCAEGYTAILRVSQERIGRELAEADLLKTELVSMISHDLKTPLTAIQACAVEMLEEGAEISEPQRQRFLELILQNTERLSRLISHILDVSKIEARALDLSPVPLDLRRVVRRLVEGIAPAAPIRLELPSDLPEVMADRDAVERILVNLVDNAVRYSPPGEAVVVAARRVDGSVELQVCDRGPGIPADRRDGLFSKFYQVDSSHGGRRTGSGLGLAIVRGLAQAMGGEAGYAPNEPTGSVFWVRMPTAAEERAG